MARTPGLTWDPDRYLANAGHRLRAGFELLARVGEPPEGVLYDLGCGTGDHAAAIAERWPGREVVGIDRSPEMLERARERSSAVRWVEADLDGFTPPADAALLFSSAALHWVEEPAAMLRDLLAGAPAGAILAAQMPLNFDAPSHVLLREVAAEWGQPVRRPDVPGAARAYELLAPLAAAPPDCWETEYQHALTGEDAVLRWVEGTALTPVRAALGDAEYAAFRARYGRALREAYPPRADGVTLLGFRRVFALAVRRAGRPGS